MTGVLVVVIDPETMTALVAFVVMSGEVLREVRHRRERRAAAEHAHQETIMEVVRLARVGQARSACSSWHHQDGTTSTAAETPS
ncbi:hypothetical protein ABT352_38655 [Streptosporangium sp. NPDC000563]|uniref:hypothetical protein n=1 Tax=Streptosporangium sp. NPDC000563 TaxID=3154366 RepID=UPI00331E7E06